MAKNLNYLGTDWGGHVVNLNLIPHDSTVISAGLSGDISFDLELIKRKRCKIIGIGPTNKEANYIKKCKSRGIINDDNFIFYQKALYGEHGIEINFYKNTIIAGHWAGMKPASVKTISLDYLLSTYDNISVVKIDIEGSEYSVIESLNSLSVPQLCIEFHHYVRGSTFTKENTLQCIEKIKGLGYELACDRHPTRGTKYFELTFIKNNL